MNLVQVSILLCRPDGGKPGQHGSDAPAAPLQNVRLISHRQQSDNVFGEGGQVQLGGGDALVNAAHHAHGKALGQHGGFALDVSGGVKRALGKQTVQLDCVLAKDVYLLNG